MGKYCLLAKEYKKGWRLAICIGNKTKYVGFWFKTIEDIKKIINANIVYVHLKDK